MRTMEYMHRKKKKRKKNTPSEKIQNVELVLAVKIMRGYEELSDTTLHPRRARSSPVREGRPTNFTLYNVQYKVV